MTTARELAPPHTQVLDAAGPSASWLTLVHGASQDSRLFSAQIAAFGSDHRLLLVDLPGHGRSAGVPGPFGLEEYATSVLAAMNEAGVDSTHYWGTHTGAGVGLLLASRHAARFRTLVLEGAVLPGASMPSITEWLERARATARDAGVAAAREQWFREAPWFEVIRERATECRAAEHRAMVSEFPGGPWLDEQPARPPTPLAEVLPSIRVPVLLVNGERDLADFLRVAAELAQKLPKVERVVVPGAGGFPLWEFPETVNARVRAFLQSFTD